MSSDERISAPLHYGLRAILSASGIQRGFVLYRSGGVTTRLDQRGMRRLEGDWDALDAWLPGEGEVTPLLQGGQTVGMVWTAPGETLGPLAAAAATALLAQVPVPPGEGADLSGQPGAAALLDREGRLCAVTPAWLSLFGLTLAVLGQRPGDVRSEWQVLEPEVRAALFGPRPQPELWFTPPRGVPQRLGGELRPWPAVGQTTGKDDSPGVLWTTRLAASPEPDQSPPYRALFEQASDAQWLTTATGTVVALNVAAGALEGIGGQSVLLGEPVWSAAAWRGVEGVRRQVRAAALRAARGEVSETVLGLRGSPPARLLARPFGVQDADARLLFELRELQYDPQDLARRLALLGVLLAHVGDGVVVCDAQGRTVLVGGAARDWSQQVEWRAGADTWTGQTGALQGGSRPLQRALRGEHLLGEELVVVDPAAAPQTGLPVRVSTYPLGEGLGAVALVRDLSEQRRLLRHVMQVRRSDPLTELLNRQAFLVAVDAALEDRRRDPECRHAALLCELGEFAAVAARHDPAQGHRLWLEGAARFRRVFRGSDAVARFEHGQFAALLTQPGGDEGLGHVLARLRERFTEPFLVAGEPFVPELRVGLVADLGPELSSQAVLAQAQAALRPL